MKVKKKSSYTGNRYTPAEKRRITTFVNAFDRKHGRGGIAAAQKKFNISYIAIRSWLMGVGSERKKRGLEPVLQRVGEMKLQLGVLEREIKRLKREY